MGTTARRSGSAGFRFCALVLAELVLVEPLEDIPKVPDVFRLRFYSAFSFVALRCATARALKCIRPIPAAFRVCWTISGRAILLLIGTMSVEPLANYIRTHRRRAALSQDEVAFLLGCEHGTKISRYERERRTPTLEAALALEAVFNVPVSELFAGRFHTVEQSVVMRAQELAEKLRRAKPSPAIMAKLSLLMAICEKECRMDS